MPRAPKIAPKGLPDNALARNALDAIQQIEEEAKARKREHLDKLVEAKAALVARQEEIQAQIDQIDKAMSALTGKPVTAPRVRRNLEEIRQRVHRWMTGHPGQKLAAGELAKEFPELEGTAVSTFMKPLIQEGKVKVDASEGIKRSRYFVDA